MNRSTDFIPFARPSIGHEEEQAVIQVLRSGWLTTAGVTDRFEKEFARKVGAAHALAVNSATAGLHLSLEALGIGRDDFVLTTPYTFAATAEIIRYLGAHPLFVDICEDGPNIDPDLVARSVSGSGTRIAAVLPVHIAGEPCDMDPILAAASERDIPLVEDCAHAFPVRTPGGYAGTLGAAGVYSFYATKTITTGEGGMIVTEDDALAGRIRVMRLHGIDRPVWDRYSSKNAGSWDYDVIAAGYKYNMPDLAAAIGRVQLEKAERLRDRRTAIAQRYLERFAHADFIELPRPVPDHAWHLFMIRLRLDTLEIERDSFMERLISLGVGCSVHFKPLHLMSYYRNTYGLKPEDFPRALSRFHSTISLPIYPDLKEEEVERVIDAVLEVGMSEYRRSIHAVL